MVKILKGLSKAILTLIVLIAAIFLIFSFWFGFEERPMPFQDYVLQIINDKSAPFSIDPQEVTLKFTREYNFINISVKNPIVKKDGKEVFILPDLFIKTNPITAIRREKVSLHFNFGDTEIKNLFPSKYSKGTKVNVNFVQLFEIFKRNREISEAFSINLNNIELGEGFSFDLYKLSLEELGEESAVLNANFYSKDNSIKLGVKMRFALDESKNLKVEIVKDSLDVKKQNLYRQIGLESQKIDFEFAALIMQNALEVRDVNLKITGDATLSYKKDKYKFKDIDTSGSIDFATQKLDFSKFNTTLDDNELSGNLSADKKGISFSFELQESEYKKVLNLIPQDLFKGLKTWLQKSIKQANISFVADGKYDIEAKKLDYEVSIPFFDAEMELNEDVPRITNGEGAVTVQPGRVIIQVADANILDIEGIVADGEVKLPTHKIKIDQSVQENKEKSAEELSIISGLESDFDSEFGKSISRMPILRLRISSFGEDLDDVLKVLSLFRDTGDFEIDAVASVDTQVFVQMPIGLSKNIKDAMNLRIESKLAFEEFDTVYDNNLQDLKLNIIYENDEVEAKGSVIYDNSIPLKLSYENTLGPKFKFDPYDVAVFYNDDIKKLEKVFDVPDFLSGKFNARVSLKGKDQVEIYSDLVGLGINAPSLFLKKSPDSSGKLSFNIKRAGEATNISDINFQASHATVKGGLNIDSAKNISGEVFYDSAEIGQLKIGYSNGFLSFSSPKLDFTKHNFFSLMFGKGTLGSGNYAGNIQSVLLKNGISLKGLKVENKFCPNCKLEMQAKMLPKNSDIQMIKQGKSILASSNDAGSILKGLDIFEKMEGGTLSMKMDGNANGEIEGNITIDDFRVTQNNFFIKLFALPSLTVSPNTVKEVVEGGSLRFKYLTCPITMGDSKITFRKCIAKGKTINIKISGIVDLNANTIRMDGVFVPQNILNSVVKEIPIIGKVLSGGSNEGVIATTFKIEGSLDDPRIVINPLSTLTPGFTREILNVFK